MDASLAGLDATQRAAAEALIVDAGCSAERSSELVGAVEKMGRADALETAAGTARISGSLVDMRVERLRKLIGALGVTAALPNAYELSAIFRITPSQARSLLRTYEVRHASDVRDRMDNLVKAATAAEVNVNDVKIWRIEFDDPAVLEYAHEKLRKRGLSKSVERDPGKLQLKVERALTDRHGQNAKQILGFST